MQCLVYRGSSATAAVQGVQDQVTALQGQMTIAQGSLTTLNGQMAAANSAIGTSQTNITNLQSSTTTIQNQVNGMLNSAGGFPYVVATPAAGSTYNAVAGFNLIESGGLLATLTINLPAGTFNGQFLALFFLNGVTLVSWTGAARNSSPIALGAANEVQFLWVPATTSWHRCV